MQHPIREIVLEPEIAGDLGGTSVYSYKPTENEYIMGATVFVQLAPLLGASEHANEPLLGAIEQSPCYIDLPAMRAIDRFRTYIDAIAVDECISRSLTPQDMRKAYHMHTLDSWKKYSIQLSRIGFWDSVDIPGMFNQDVHVQLPIAQTNRQLRYIIHWHDASFVVVYYDGMMQPADLHSLRKGDKWIVNQYIRLTLAPIDSLWRMCTAADHRNYEYFIERK